MIFRWLGNSQQRLWFLTLSRVTIDKPKPTSAPTTIVTLTVNPLQKNKPAWISLNEF